MKYLNFEDVDQVSSVAILTILNFFYMYTVPVLIFSFTFKTGAMFTFPSYFCQSQSRYGLETQLNSLFYLFVRVYADLCTVKTMDFRYNEAILR